MLHTYSIHAAYIQHTCCIHTCYLAAHIRHIYCIHTCYLAAHIRHTYSIHAAYIPVTLLHILGIYTAYIPVTLLHILGIYTAYMLHIYILHVYCIQNNWYLPQVCCTQAHEMCSLHMCRTHISTMLHTLGMYTAYTPHIYYNYTHILQLHCIY